ncbi:MAG: hypothetical protein WC648_04170 [Candidatus Paceibacterota bacterium]|jgi:hypothetical protein
MKREEIFLRGSSLLTDIGVMLQNNCSKKEVMDKRLMFYEEKDIPINYAIYDDRLFDNICKRLQKTPSQKYLLRTRIIVHILAKICMGKTFDQIKREEQSFFLRIIDRVTRWLDKDVFNDMCNLDANYRIARIIYNFFYAK